MQIDLFNRLRRRSRKARRMAWDGFDASIVGSLLPVTSGRRRVRKTGRLDLWRQSRMAKLLDRRRSLSANL